MLRPRPFLFAPVGCLTLRRHTGDDAREKARGSGDGRREGTKHAHLFRRHRLSKFKHTCCVLSQDGVVKRPSFDFPNSKEGFGLLKKRWLSLGPKEQILIGMNSGITYGTAYQVAGFASSFEKECGYPLKKILTGGNGGFIKGLLSDFTFDPFILLKGLDVIYGRVRA